MYFKVLSLRYWLLIISLWNTLGSWEALPARRLSNSNAMQLKPLPDDALSIAFLGTNARSVWTKMPIVLQMQLRISATGIEAISLGHKYINRHYPDTMSHGVNMGPTWVLSAPDGPHVGPMNLVIRVGIREIRVAHASGMLLRPVRVRGLNGSWHFGWGLSQLPVTDVWCTKAIW